MLRKIFRYIHKAFKSASKKRPAKRRRPLSKKKSKVVRRPPKKILRRPVAKAKPEPKAVSKKVEPKLKTVYVGDVTHFFPRIQVIVLHMKGQNILVGDQIQLKGSATDFVQKIASLQIESVDVKSAKKGQLVGLKVNKPAKVGDKVFKVLK